MTYRLEIAILMSSAFLAGFLFSEILRADMITVPMPETTVTEGC